MFSTKRRLKVTLLVVAVLVISLGMFVQLAVSDCVSAKKWCCGALKQARKYCGSKHFDAVKCAWYQQIAFIACGAAAEECGYSVYHDCPGSGG